MRLVVLSGLLLGIIAAVAPQLHAQSQESPTLFGSDYELSFGQLRDTLYVLDSAYLEVRLDQQMIYHRFRSGRVEKFPCSTGDAAIEDGIRTRPGIFTVQWKSKKYMSKQFEVYLNYWMPFDGGIGFHGLAGRSYYRYLGRRPSSHGCVRISNETGSKLFPNVPPGTVVYVNDGSPARVLCFGDSSIASLRFVGSDDESLLKQRLDDVQAERWDAPSLSTRLALPVRTKLPEGIAVGKVNARRITQRPIPLIKLSSPPVDTPHPVSISRPELYVPVSEVRED
jgi:hypothetical protein